MFGWLATHSKLCHHGPRIAAIGRSRPMTPHALARMLPGLGSVLYLQAAAHAALPGDLPQSLLVERAFVPLLSTHWLTTVGVITEDGPREWCECMDASGRTLARWHLLPDTDYLAWDAMAASCVANIPPSLATRPLRPDRAMVTRFQLREFAGLLLLEHHAPARLSPLGGRIASRIARAESALLQP